LEEIKKILPGFWGGERTWDSGPKKDGLRGWKIVQRKKRLGGVQAAKGEKN